VITVDVDTFSETMMQRLREGADALYSVGYAITYRCNVACVHCYAEGADRGAPPELSVEEATRVFDQFAEVGCLHCTVTGGEPLVRPDFEALWTMIAAHGIRRLLFTNATLVDDRKAALLRDIPPDWVEISIYGADAAHHDAVTRVPGSFDATFRGIRRLEAAGLRVRLKTMIMRPTVDHIREIKQLAQSVGDGSFRLDGQLMGTFAGGDDMDALRVPPERLVAVEQEFGNAVMERMCHEADRLRGRTKTHLYACGAARHSVYLSPWGDLHPCLTAAHVSRSLRAMSVAQAVAELQREIHDRPLREGHACRECDAYAFCNSCAAAAKLDAGDEQGCSPYRCGIAKLRRNLYHTYLSARNPGDFHAAPADPPADHACKGGHDEGCDPG
jgi:radical SAM protein with 4Fe4S-binding SPASM domain